MDDCISRQAAMVVFENSGLDDDSKDTAVRVLEQLPSAQPEQKKGKWERVYLDHVAFGERPSIFYCSSCNQCVPFPTNFCPACGSDNRQS